MEQFYTEYVYDYGSVLKDLVSKNIPSRLSGVPDAPSLDISNFKVVQINKHLTDTPNSALIKQKHNYQNSLKSEINQIQESILDRNKKLKVTRFKSESSKKQSFLEVKELTSKKESRNKLLSTVTREIIDISKNPITKAEPKYRLRGFWEFPEAVVSKGTLPQEIIQFRVEYRYVGVDGTETSIDQYKVNDSEKASFSNWKSYKSDIRKRIYDSESDEYYWEIEDLEDPDIPNINQLDLGIQAGERIEFRVKSISEVGWPDSPIESDWSSIMSIDFPDDLNNILNENEFILQEANKEDIRLTLNNELDSKGLDEHLSDTIVDNGKVIHHDASKILSGFKDENGSSLDLFEYLKKLESKIKTLEEKISRSRGILEITMLRNNEEFKISNGSETSFKIECEDYLDDATGSNIPTGRVYENNVYVIRDFVLRVRNSATESPLGLLSDKNYLQNSNIFNDDAPQTFWVNEQDELLRSDLTSQTRTQLNNQFIWMVNYDGVSDTSIKSLSRDIGNSFVSKNEITNVLSSSEYNVGYGENSILSFVGNNNSLTDLDKWVEDSATDTFKLLTSVHPVVKDLESIVENNSSRVKSIESGDNNDIIIPINIYFKMNSLDPNQAGGGYEYINMNRFKNTKNHIKKLKFLLEDEAENRPFTFSLKFTINSGKNNNARTRIGKVFN